MKHLLNICNINGAEVEPVDIITFGAPCQDLSVAGKRAGLKHSAMGDDETTRSGLFYEAIRIIKEMREATNNEYPKYAVYENVPGAFSSNKGHDFHAVLEALCSVCDDTVSIPRPYDRGRTDRLVWRNAGEIVGNGYSVAWRVLDAQYWGVPQRRKRIYLVADFTGRRAGEILFKPDGLRGDFTQGNEAGQETSANVVGGVDGSVGAAGVVSKGNGDCFIMPERHMSLSVGGGQAGQGYPCTVYSFDSLSSNSMKSSNPHEPVIALQANGKDRADTAGCNGAGWRENKSYTLNTIDRHAVCFDARGNGDGETACTITGDHQNRITDYTAVTVQEAYGIGNGQADQTDIHDKIGALNCMHDQQAVLVKSKPPRKYIIRRLTPTECARLQGFPDKWGWLAPYDPADADFWEQVRKTHAEISGKTYKPTKNLKKWYDKLHTDSAEYKMWGNGIALPNAEYVIHGIAEQGAKTLGSLFDGSGGFPLAGVLNGIKPVWASEVEPYCIAVTKSRFG